MKLNRRATGNKAEKKEGINNFFDKFEEKYGVEEGFSFYHSEYFESMKKLKRMKYLKMTLLKIQKTVLRFQKTI